MKPTSTTSKLAAYLRVSTDEQRDTGTIATQRNSIRDYCRYKKISVAAYFEDEAVSGALPMWKRPHGAALWKAIENREFDTLLTYKIDRLGRRIKYVLDFTDHCTAHNVTILSIEDNNLDLSSATGRLMLNILAVFAENERDVFRERSLAGKRNKAESGKVISHAPYGYAITEDYHLEIDPLRAPVIKLIFERYAAGRSSREIITELEVMKAPLPLRGGGKWRFDNVLKYLENPAYYGEYHHFRSPETRDGKRLAAVRAPEKIIVISCPPIVSKPLWDQAQQMRQSNTLLGPKSATRFYLLRGLIRCGNCGLTYTGHTINPKPRLNKQGELIQYAEHRYYDCASKTSRDYDFCGNTLVRQDDLNDLIWTDIEGFIRNPESIMECLLEQQREMSKNSNNIQSDIAKIDKILLKIQKQKDNIVFAIGKEKLSYADAASAIERINSEIDALSARRSEVEIKMKDETADGGRQTISNAREMLLELNARVDRTLSDEEKGQIVRLLVKGIVIRSKTVNGKKLPEAEVTYFFEKKIAEDYFSSVDLAFRRSSRKNINARPRNLFEPALVRKLMRPPEARPYSDENWLVITCTSAIDSSDG